MPAEEEPTDEALMWAYAEGDTSAFEPLFQRHRAPLFTYLRHQTGSRSVAEDLFQEVFLRLVRRRREYRRAGSFRSWLFTIAHNAMTDGRRRSALREAVSESDAMEYHDATSERPASTADPLGASHATDLRERIEAALLRIPAEQREVFLLRERGGLDFQRIAEVTGSGIATVKSRMRYALSNLRRRLADELPSIEECLHE